MTKKKPKELLELLELPDSFRECWNWFLSLNNSRQAGMGMSPISYTEMLSYFTLLQIDPSPEEIDIIKMFDYLAMKAHSDQQEQNNAQKTKK
jgi:hypothetical protein